MPVKSVRPAARPATPARNILGSMQPADWLLVATLAAVFFTLCTLRSRAHLLWPDELYGARVVGAPSWRAMLRGWYQGADGGGLLYYLLARGWTTLFGFTDLTLRLFSTAGMCVALALTWATLRRYTSILTTALAVAPLYCCSPTLLWQSINGRFYGLFLASSAWAALMFVVAAETPLETPLPTSILLATALAHLTLIGSHILGCVYSLTLLLGLIFLDRLQNRRPRWPLYAAAVTGWLLLPLSYHAIHASSAIATKAFWTHKPAPIDLLWSLATFGRLIALLLAAATLLALLAWLLRRLRHQPTPPTLPRPAYLLAGSLLAAACILFAKSQFGISVFADRYLLPVSIATALFLAACLNTFLPPRPSTAKPRLTALAALALLPLGAYTLTRQINPGLYPAPGYPEQIAALIPPGAPVMASMPTFPFLSHYDPHHRYLFMLDWPYDLDPQHPPPDPWDARLMENWRRAGYLPGRILPCPQLFAQFPDLYLLLDFQRQPWFNDRLLHNPAYTVRELTHNNTYFDLTLWSIHQNHPAPPPC